MNYFGIWNGRALMNDEKTLVLKHSECGFSIVSGELAESPKKKDEPKESDISTPQWVH